MKKQPIQYPAIVRRIGVLPAIKDHTYQLCNDGNVWFCSPRMGSNCGPLADFMEAVKKGRVRITLDEDGKTYPIPN